MRKTLLLSAVLLPLGGCVNLGDKAPASLITLTPEVPATAGAGASGDLANALVVLEPSADASIAVLRVPVRMAGGTVAYLKKVAWVERPSRQFQHLLTETLRGKGDGRLVVEGDVATKGLKISGRLMNMGYDEATRSAIVRFDAIKEWSGGKMETRRFEHTVSGVKADGRAIGPALNEAANAVAKDVGDWVG